MLLIIETIYECSPCNFGFFAGQTETRIEHILLWNFLRETWWSWHCNCMVLLFGLVELNKEYFRTENFCSCYLYRTIFNKRTWQITAPTPITTPNWGRKLEQAPRAVIWSYTVNPLKHQHINPSSKLQLCASLYFLGFPVHQIREWYNLSTEFAKIIFCQ